ncbi:MAG: hypothetical protein CVU65_15570 [Deltaproteobacteria bacterium HGW-Deltaproteobacteria-22]|nr:MAG: hypothetical protein CVU65_15570 [Deltaproteobacteria bacterium HGW-Deltaproteobacteria-22]
MYLVMLLHLAAGITFVSLPLTHLLDYESSLLGAAVHGFLLAPTVVVLARRLGKAPLLFLPQMLLVALVLQAPMLLMLFVNSAMNCPFGLFTGLAFWKTVNGTLDIKKSLGGPILIAKISGETFRAGLLPFFSLIAFISINLAVINLFPIPILDGGYLLLFLIEGITGKAIEDRPREIAQQIGLFILIMLMLFAFYNDIIRLVKGD